MFKEGRSHFKKKTLTLEEKIRVLDYAQDHPKLGCRKIADVFEVGKTQIAHALKDKQNIGRNMKPSFLRVLSAQEKLSTRK